MTNFKIVSGQEALQQTTEGFITAVYAQSGAGKTRFCVGAAKKNKTLYIDSELSAGKLIHQLKPDKAFIENFHRPVFLDENQDERPISLQEVVEIFKNKELVGQYDVIVIDSLTHILGQEVKNTERGKGGKKMSFQEWGEMGSVFEDFLSFCQQKGIEIIITLHEEEKDDDGVLVKRPKAVGNMASKVLENRADTVLYLFKDGKDYVASCDRGALTYVAKNRLGLQEEYRNEEIDYIKLQEQFPKYDVVPASKEELAEIAKLLKESKTDEVKLKEKLGIKGDPNSIQAMKMISYMEQKIKYLANQKEDDKKPSA